MKTKIPQVSIGLPVYNGENFLINALDSLLAQTFTDFEIIISDNASTDGTQQICEAYASKDSRIRFYQQDSNIGAARNYNFVFEKATGKYFKWAAHDDICAPCFLEMCVAVLEQDPSVVLSYTQTNILYLGDDSEKSDPSDVRSASSLNPGRLVPSKYIGKYDISYEPGGALLRYNLKMDVDNSQVHQRFGDLIFVYHECFPIFGLIRSDVLKRTQLIGSFTSSDRTLLAELSLYGPFYEVPEYLFTRRVHSQVSSLAYKGRRSRIAWFDPSKNSKFVFPNWRVLTEYSRSVQKAPLESKVRLRCYGQLARYVQSSWKGLVMDAVKVVRGTAHD